jgi:Trypsin-like peptidase domain/FHA domain
MERLVRNIVSFVFAAVLAGAWSLPAAAQFDSAQVDKSVVRIFSKIRKDGKVGWASGTGFVLNRDGYVATNNHVIDNNVEIIVPDGSYERKLKATVVWADKNVDLAVIKVEGLSRPPIALAVPEPLKGDPVYAIGYPGRGDEMGTRPSLDTTVTSGVVGKVFVGGHNLRNPETMRRLVQHNAQINPGNSGGPLVNNCNQVVAINTYGKTALLKILKNPTTGQPIAVGSVPAGIFIGSHVSVLIKNLKAHNIAFTPALAPCKILKGGGTIIKQIVQGGAPVDMYFYIGAAFLVGTAGVALALRKPRERIVKVVETYSQMLRRKAAAGGSEHSLRAGSPAGRPSFAATTDGGAPVAAARVGPAARGAGWVLTGVDRSGEAVRLVITDSELQRSPKGRVIGRKASLVHHVLGDRSVSRRHARIVPLDGGIGVVDLNSSHGTKVAGRALSAFAEPALVRVGGEISIGGVELKVSRQ